MIYGSTVVVLWATWFVPVALRARQYWLIGGTLVLLFLGRVYLGYTPQMSLWDVIGDFGVTLFALGGGFVMYYYIEKQRKKQEEKT